MINLVVKYLAGELTPDEKELFLLSVTEKETLRNELIEYHHLLAYLSLHPRDEDNINTEKKLLKFLEKIENKR